MSERPLAARLLVKPGDPVWVSDAARAPLLGPLPDGARIATGAVAEAQARVAVVFVDDAAAAGARSTPTRRRSRPSPSSGCCTPRAAGRTSTGTACGGSSRHTASARSRNVSVDDTWSALRFRELRPDEPPFTGGS